MAKANSIRYFMRDELKEARVVEVPGIKTFCDEEGNPVPFQIRELSSSEIFKLREGCKKRTMVKDKKGKPMLVGGEVKYTDEYDTALVTAKLIETALVFPDMHDPELLKFYNVLDSVELVNKIFRRVEDYNYIANAVTEVCGLTNEDDSETIDEIKN